MQEKYQMHVDEVDIYPQRGLNPICCTAVCTKDEKTHNVKISFLPSLGVTSQYNKSLQDFYFLQE